MTQKKNFRKIALSTMAFSAAAVATVPAVTAAKNVSFKDVTSKSDHYDAIMALAGKGIIHGYKDGSFKPYNNVTRGQVALMLKQAKNLKIPSNRDKELGKYKDVKKVDKGLGDAIAAVSAAGVFKGQSGQFKPWSNLTREQMATVLVQAYNLKKYDTGKDVKVKLSNVSETHRENVQILANLGITTAVGNKDFRPHSPVTRAQFATFVYKAQQVVNGDKEAPVISIKGDQTVNVKYGEELKLPNVTVSDNKDQNLKINTVIKDPKGNEIDKIDTKKPGTYTVTYNAKDAAGNVAKEVTVKVVVAEEGVAVKNIKKIDGNGVTVTFEPVNKDRFDEQLTVLDNKANRIAVKPVTIAAGDTEATFKFINPVDKLEGVWSVGGKEYNFELAANVQKFRDADSQLALNNAFDKLGIAGAEAKNAAAYLEKKQSFISQADQKGEQLTVASIQAWVNQVNDEIENGAKSEALAKEVTEAVKANNDTALKNALENTAFKRVNFDWLTGNGEKNYKSAIDNQIKADGALVKNAQGIQEVINGINNAYVTEASDNLNTISDKAVLQDKKVLISKYATPNADGNLSPEVTAALKKIDQQLAVVDVVNSPTPNTLEANVRKLAELVNTNDKTVIDLDKYIPSNGKIYINKLQNAKSAEDVANAIDAGNTEAGANSVKAVQDAAQSGDADTLLTALKAYPGIKNVADNNKDVYISGGFGTAMDIQAEVDLQNFNAVKNADSADKLIAALKALGAQNVNEANKDLYFGENNSNFKTLSGETNAQRMLAVQDAIASLNKTGNTNKAVTTINQATTTTAVKEGLDALALPVYLNVPTADRLHIAEELLKVRPDSGFNSPDDIGLALVTPAEGGNPEAGIIPGYTGALDQINTLKKTSSNTEAIDLLKAAGNNTFNNLSQAKQSSAAENFLKNAEFNSDGAIKQFNTLASVNEALNAAIQQTQ
ncbi:S-layer homology domain-containing protein [Aciduricibacillus chroicocephali]|uniref:S-layer homology domain-containing protein n=1 Tax=Aciduricibacillus chroicocephali TaxID=3054939 RepID=A0ABY9KUK8_9BACI|nr:S-layer homology domain-containing protein [Bacillaceae bacterium 44XB]